LEVGKKKKEFEYVFVSRILEAKNFEGIKTKLPKLDLKALLSNQSF
jgi:hypothetical protein